MKPVIAEDVARQEIAEWAEFFESDLGEAEIQGLLPAVKRGRITLDTEAEAFKVRLKSPIELENKPSLEYLIVREPTTGEIQKAGNIKDEMKLVVSLLSTITGHPVGIINRMKQRDLMVLSGIFGFFG